MTKNPSKSDELQALLETSLILGERNLDEMLRLRCLCELALTALECDAVNNAKTYLQYGLRIA